MSYQVLAVVLQAVPLPPETLAAVSQTCKALHGLAQHSWKALASDYNERGTLSFKAQKPTKKPEGISKTAALKTFKLAQPDLDALGRGVCHITRHPVWGNRIAYYRLEDVWWLACTKYGGPQKARQALAPRLSKARLARMATWQAQGVDVTPEQHAACVEPFLRNGVGGVRSVFLRLQRFDHLVEANLPYYELWVEPYVERKLSLDDVRQRCERAEKLAWALATAGVELDLSIPLCRAFVERGHGTLDTIVNRLANPKPSPLHYMTRHILQKRGRHWMRYEDEDEGDSARYTALRRLEATERHRRHQLTSMILS